MRQDPQKYPDYLEATAKTQFTGADQRTWGENWPELQLAINTRVRGDHRILAGIYNAGKRTGGCTQTPAENAEKLKEIFELVRRNMEKAAPLQSPKEAVETQSGGNCMGQRAPPVESSRGLRGETGTKPPLPPTPLPPPTPQQQPQPKPEPQQQGLPQPQTSLPPTSPPTQPHTPPPPPQPAPPTQPHPTPPRAPTPQPAPPMPPPADAAHDRHGRPPVAPADRVVEETETQAGRRHKDRWAKLFMLNGQRFRLKVRRGVEIRVYVPQ
ncbi:protein TsetseEP-like [Drosophila santomea]|uniref:protein TsetseEP-like n=1 Tax=Drosophila santomea TaxID=129105 RepID=UPI001CCCF8E4|nr:protein TsetseEP-like [Drosophila santomea]